MKIKKTITIDNKLYCDIINLRKSNKFIDDNFSKLCSKLFIEGLQNIDNIDNIDSTKE